jgi:hypothetical protein
MLKSRPNEKLIAKIREGETVCVVDPPFNWLWAAPLHPPRQYTIQEAWAPNECNGHRQVDAPRRRRH